MRVFHGCSVFESFFFACHSSQLTEQKEGLFYLSTPSTRKVDNGGKKRGGRTKIMSFIVDTNVVAS